MPKAVPSQPAGTAVLSGLPLPGLALAGVKGMGTEKTGKGQGWDAGEIAGKAEGYRMQICGRSDFSSAGTEELPARSESNRCLRHRAKAAWLE